MKEMNSGACPAPENMRKLVDLIDHSAIEDLKDAPEELKESVDEFCID